MLLTVSQLAAELQIHEETVRQMAREKRIPFKRVGRLYRFVLDDVMTSLGAPATPRRASAALAGPALVVGPADWSARRK